MRRSLDPESARYRMVARDLAGRGIEDEDVIAAMATVPREAFVPPALSSEAYADNALPIGRGQTISQPYVVAAMVEALALTGSERVLEVGTGSGYAAAVLSRLAGEVYTIERHQELAEGARQRLREGGYENTRVRCGDGTQGWPERAPFDAIIVAAGGPEIPEALRKQLKSGGRIVAPVGPHHAPQALLKETLLPDGSFDRETLGAVRFVPLIRDSPDTGGASDP